MAGGEIRTDTIGRLDLPGTPRPNDEHWQAAARLLEPVGTGTDPWAGGWRLNALPVLPTAP